MRIPRVRLRVRQMMVGVGVAAVLLWCSLMIPRVAFYRQRLAYAVAGEAEFKRCRIFCSEKSRALATEGDAELSRRYHNLSKGYQLMEIWGKEIRIKYERTMLWPWRAVPRDPPHPDVQL
jgi:hypothetical protein